MLFLCDVWCFINMLIFYTSHDGLALAILAYVVRVRHLSLADISQVFWLLLAPLAERYANYTAGFLSSCSKFQSWCFWVTPRWSLPFMWKMVSLFKDSTPINSFWLFQWFKSYTGSWSSNIYSLSNSDYLSLLSIFEVFEDWHIIWQH